MSPITSIHSPYANTSTSLIYPASGRPPDPEGLLQRIHKGIPWILLASSMHCADARWVPTCRSIEETEALVLGVEQCGGGKWADIKKLGYDVIAARSAVDLKDKWRNLMRVAMLPHIATRCVPCLASLCLLQWATLNAQELQSFVWKVLLAGA